MKFTNSPSIPNAKLTNDGFLSCLIAVENLKLDAQSASAPLGQLLGVERVHWDATVRRRKLAQDAQALRSRHCTFCEESSNATAERLNAELRMRMRAECWLARSAEQCQRVCEMRSDCRLLELRSLGSHYPLHTTYYIIDESPVRLNGRITPAIPFPLCCSRLSTEHKQKILFRNCQRLDNIFLYCQKFCPQISLFCYAPIIVFIRLLKKSARNAEWKKIGLYHLLGS
jgi:hypothetical protein